MKRAALLQLLLAVGLSACNPKIIRYYGTVVEHDIPKNPTVTVIPSGGREADIDFANKVESYLLQSKVKVVERPSYENTGEVRAKAAQEGALDFVALYQETDASYVVATYSGTRRIRIVERASGQVVGETKLVGDPMLSVQSVLSAAGLIDEVQPSEAGYKVLLSMDDEVRSAVWAMLSPEQQAEILAHAIRISPDKLNTKTAKVETDSLLNMDDNMEQYPVLKDTSLKEADLRLLVWLNEQEPFLNDPDKDKKQDRAKTIRRRLVEKEKISKESPAQLAKPAKKKKFSGKQFLKDLLAPSSSKETNGGDDKKDDGVLDF